MEVSKDDLWARIDVLQERVDELLKDRAQLNTLLDDLMLARAADEPVDLAWHERLQALRSKAVQL
jgi:hypothetical protein